MKLTLLNLLFSLRFSSQYLLLLWPLLAAASHIHCMGTHLHSQLHSLVRERKKLRHLPSNVHVATGFSAEEPMPGQIYLPLMVASVQEAMSGSVPLLIACNPYAKVLPFTNVRHASPSHALSVNISGPRMHPFCPLLKPLVVLEMVVREEATLRAVRVGDSEPLRKLATHPSHRDGYRLLIPAALALLHKPKQLQRRPLSVGQHLHRHHILTAQG